MAGPELDFEAEDFDIAPRYVDAENPNQPYQGPQKMLSRLLGEQEQIKKRTALAWSDRKDYRTPQGKKVFRDKLRGELDLRLAYMGPFGTKSARVEIPDGVDQNGNAKWKAIKNPGLFYVQNGKVLDSTGKPRKLAEIPELMRTRILIDAKRHEYIEDEIPLRELVETALSEWKKVALQNDPLVCQVCMVRTKDPEDYTAHVFNEHRAEFEKRYQRAEKTKMTHART